MENLKVFDCVTDDTDKEVIKHVRVLLA
jgi:hypothetical protein